MIPCSSPRNSGWRATDWIIEAKTVPMPMPAPSEPSPMPSPKPSALPALTTSPEVAARIVASTSSSLVGGLDRRADVDGGQGGEDKRLDGDDDHHFEEVEGDPDHERDRDDDVEGDPAEDEDQADRDEDQHGAGQHVGVETDAEADDPEDVRDRLEHGHRPDHRLRDSGGNEALEVPGTVPAEALHVGEDDAEEGEHERHGELRGDGVDPPGRDAVPLLPRQRQRQEADGVERPDEKEERRDVREPAADRLRGEALLGDLGLGDLVDGLADGLALAEQERQAAAHEEDPEQHRQRRADREVDDGLVDREVERTEVDRDPLLELELVRGIEGRRQHRAHGRCSPVKYSSRETA